MIMYGCVVYGMSLSNGVGKNLFDSAGPDAHSDNSVPGYQIIFIKLVTVGRRAVPVPEKAPRSSEVVSVAYAIYGIITGGTYADQRYRASGIT